MNEKLTKRLTEVGLTRDIIKKVINIKDDQQAIIYTSHMDNLGNRYSDFDIYVLSEQFNDVSAFKNCGNHWVKMREFDAQFYNVPDIPYLLADVEYWTFGVLNTIIERVHNKQFIDAGELKLLTRIQSGEVLLNNTTVDIQRVLHDVKLNTYAKIQFTRLSDAFLHDSMCLKSCEEYYGAITCARKALTTAIAGINAKNGKINANVDKWAMKIYLEAEADGDEKQEILRFLFQEGIDRGKENVFLEEMVIFTQGILYYQLEYLGQKHWLNADNYTMSHEDDEETLYAIRGDNEHL